MESQQMGVSHYITGIFLRDRPVNKSVFNLVIGLVLMWGFVSNYLTVSLMPIDLINSINIWLILLGFILVSTAGFCIMFYFEAPLYSFIGYNLVTLSVGILLSVCLQQFTDVEIVTAIQYTGIVTLLMVMLSTIFPKLFMRFSTVLPVIAASIVIVELSWILAFGQSHELFHWIVALVMCGYIGYFWSEACRDGNTLDQAIDFGGVLYMEIINLFLRILALLQSKRS